jgi:phosphatidylglycerophosphatase C
MQTETADQIIARIEEETRKHGGGASPAKGVVAFDGDGTLWDGDVGEDFFHAVVAHDDFREPARAQMEREAAEHGLTGGGTAKELASRLYQDYLAGRYPEERVCELMTWVCAGWTLEEVDAFAAGVIARGGLEARLHKEVRKVFQWAERAGLDVFLVSASPWAIIDHAARFLGLHPTHVVAAMPRYEDGRMLAEVHRPIPYAGGKVSHLRSRIGPARPLYAAFGDNAFDIALLSEASIPVAVRPKPRLRERAAEVQKLVEIARES